MATRSLSGSDWLEASQGRIARPVATASAVAPFRLCCQAAQMPIAETSTASGITPSIVRPTGRRQVPC